MDVLKFSLAYIAWEIISMYTSTCYNYKTLPQLVCAALLPSPPPSWEGENGRVQTNLLFIQHKCLELVCSLEVTFCSRLDTGISFKDPQLVHPRLFKMNRQQTYRGFGFQCGWMRGMLVYANTLSSSLELFANSSPSCLCYNGYSNFFGYFNSMISFAALWCGPQIYIITH